MNRWDVVDAVVSSHLSPTERLVMMMLIRRADTDSGAIPAQFSPSITTLTRDTGMSRSSVARTLNSLEEAGWIIRGRPPKEDQIKYHARTEYALLVPWASPTVGLGVVPHEDQPGSTVGPGVVPHDDWASPTVGLNHFSLHGSPSSSAASPRIATKPRTRDLPASEMDHCRSCGARPGELCVRDDRTPTADYCTEREERPF